MIIWIDADACPRRIKQIVFRASERLRVPVRLVANTEMPAPDSPLVTVTLVPEGFDVADNYIVENLAPDDLVITADIPLAAEVVRKGALAIDPRGTLYSEDNIGERLPIRNLLQDLRSSGLIQGGPAPFRPADTRHFAATLDRLLTQRLKNQ
jgi:uncharacterized protein YaiI (UPF0178 family)